MTGTFLRVQPANPDASLANSCLPARAKIALPIVRAALVALIVPNAKPLMFSRRVAVLLLAP